MPSLLKAAIMFVGIATPQLLQGAELEWRYQGAFSYGNGVRCDNNSIKFLGAGNDAALTLVNFNADLPSGEKKMNQAASGTCWIQFKITIPKGHTISRYETILLGGIIKNQGAHGFIDLTSFLTIARHRSINPYMPKFSLGQPIHMRQNLRPQDEIDEPLLQMIDSQKLSPAAKRVICKLTAKRSAEIGLNLQISIAAIRLSSYQSAMVNIDSIDSHVDLEPSSEPCHRS